MEKVKTEEANKDNNNTYINELVATAIAGLDNDEDKLELLRNSYLQADIIRETNPMVVQLFKCIPEILRSEAADLFNNYIMKRIASLIINKYYNKEIEEIQSIDNLHEKLVNIQLDIEQSLLSIGAEHFESDECEENT